MNFKQSSSIMYKFDSRILRYLRHSFLSISFKFVYFRHKVQSRAIIQFSSRSSGYCEQTRRVSKTSRRNGITLC